MIAAKLPQKRATVSNGLRKRPQFEQIVKYITNGQETIKYPNRMAKQIRNHPFMTQLDFFDMQEDQHRSWEEQVWQREAAQLAGAMGLTAAQARAAAGPYRGGGGGGSDTRQLRGTQEYRIALEALRGQGKDAKGKGKDDRGKDDKGK